MGEPLSMGWDVGVHVLVGLVVYGLLSLVAWGLRRWATTLLTRRVPLFCRPGLHVFYAYLTLVSVVVWVWVECVGDGGVTHVLNTAIRCFLFVRGVLLVVDGYQPSLLGTVLDVWLVMGDHRYLFLCTLRVLYPHTRAVLDRHLHYLLCGHNSRRRVVWLLTYITLTILVVAGALQTAEEWRATGTSHPDALGQETPNRSFWDYFYWSFVTLTTVGYGDITPTTEAGQAVVVLAIVVAIPSFVLLYCHQLAVGDEEEKEKSYQPAPSSPQHRIVLLGCTNPALLQEFIQDLKQPYLVERAQLLVLVERQKRDMFLDYERPDEGVFIQLIDFPPGKRRFPFEFRKNDVAVILSNREAASAEAADMEVLRLVETTKMARPSLPMVVQVLLKGTTLAIPCVRHWNEGQDQVMCYEELTEILLAQTAVARGASAILTSIISCPSPPQGTTVDDPLAAKYWAGKRKTLYFSSDVSTEDERFCEAVVHLHRTQNVWLLGYCDEDGRNPHLLPSVIPASKCRIFLRDQVAWNVVHDMDDGPTSETRAIDELRRTVRISDKRIKTLRGCDRGFLNGNPQGFDAVTLFESLTSRRIDRIYNYHNVRRRLLTANGSESSSSCVLVSNAEHGLQSLAHQVAADDGHSVDTCVSPRMFTSALAFALAAPQLYRIWHDLLTTSSRKGSVVELVVLEKTTFGEVFEMLAQHEGMLAVGVNVCLTKNNSEIRLESSSSTTSEELIPISYPHPDFSLHPNNRIIALRFDAWVLG